MSTEDIAKELVALCNASHNLAAIDRFYAPDIASFEASGPMKETHGLENVKAKNAWWYSNHEIHSSAARGPWVHGDMFVVEFVYEITPKASGQRTQMNEAALYTVQNGKIIREQFFASV